MLAKLHTAAPISGWAQGISRTAPAPARAALSRAPPLFGSPAAQSHQASLRRSLRIAAAMAEPATKKTKTEGGSDVVFSNHSVALVLDYGSQYTQLCARRVRESNVLAMLMPGDASLVRLSMPRAAHESYQTSQQCMHVDEPRASALQHRRRRCRQSVAPGPVAALHALSQPPSSHHAHRMHCLYT